MSFIVKVLNYVKIMKFDIKDKENVSFICLVNFFNLISFLSIIIFWLCLKERKNINLLWFTFINGFFFIVYLIILQPQIKIFYMRKVFLFLVFLFFYQYIRFTITKGIVIVLTLALIFFFLDFYSYSSKLFNTIFLAKLLNIMWGNLSSWYFLLSHTFYNLFHYFR